MQLAPCRGSLGNTAPRFAPRFAARVVLERRGLPALAPLDNDLPAITAIC